jgi:mRNA interferase RelE/StbE
MLVLTPEKLERLKRDARMEYISELPEKSQRLIKEKCHALAEDPFPGQGGDKELLHLEFKFYRLHISRSFTVFYI